MGVFLVDKFSGAQGVWFGWLVVVGWLLWVVGVSGSSWVGWCLWGEPGVFRVMGGCGGGVCSCIGLWRYGRGGVAGVVVHLWLWSGGGVGRCGVFGARGSLGWLEGGGVHPRAPWLDNIVVAGGFIASPDGVISSWCGWFSTPDFRPGRGGGSVRFGIPYRGF